MPGKIYLAIDSDLVTDIIRFSDGTDVAQLAEDQLRDFVVRSVETVPSFWGERLDEVAEKYAPSVWRRWMEEDETRLADFENVSKPLVWKEISVPAGSEVRMAYGDSHHYAKVAGGAIQYEGERYSPSEWARKIASDTSRNAWRDLWFKEPMSNTWVPAQLMREQAREEARKLLQKSEQPGSPS